MESHNKIWRIAKQNPVLQKIFNKKLGISGIVAQILINRGILTVEEARAFLYGDLKDLHNPFLLKDMDKAVTRIIRAIDYDERILIFGDYDVDGITSTAVLYLAIRKLGGKVGYRIPLRLEEGYGLNKDALAGASEDGYKLIITVDCGISAVDEVAYGRDLGLDIIVTDHHEASGEIPPALAVVNPKRADCHYPFKDLAGVGVAYKVAQALYEEASRENYDFLHSLLDLVALGTVADVVPMKGENRILVKHGLGILRSGTRPGIEALTEVANLKRNELTSYHLGFGLAPRLNAGGRMGDASIGVRLLLTDDLEEARTIAKELDEANRVRQETEQKILRDANEMIEKMDMLQDRVLVLASEGWHSGVIGIVASRLVESFYRPAIILSLEKGEGKGSARSIPGFNIYDALASCSSLLIKFGGHKQAAGLSLIPDNIENLRHSINRYALENIEPEVFVPQIDIDGEVNFCDLNDHLFKQIQLLTPFGHENPSPLLALRQANLLECRTVGADDKHLKLKVYQDNIIMDAIGFNFGSYKAMLEASPSLDLAFFFEKNEWNGRSTLQLNIKDLKSSDNMDKITVETAASFQSEKSSFIEGLFQRAEEFLADDYYRNITDKEEFYTKVAGVTFEGRQEIIAGLKEGEKLYLLREPHNQHDPNAIRVETASGQQVGYLNARLARHLAPVLDKGEQYITLVSAVTGGNDKNYGLNIILQKICPCDSEEEREQRRKRRELLESLSPEDLAENIRQALLGPYEYREKQVLAIESLLEGKNTMAIFGTGRGKSAVFQSVAAWKALAEKKMTIILYPLRALVNDQYLALEAKLGPLGLKVMRANGSINAVERAALFESLNTGDIDILLTTPEFAEYHLDKLLAHKDKIGFFVVDESHHISLASNSHRPAYKRLNNLLDKLGHPLVLAVTATAGDEVAEEIISQLGIEKLIIDPHIRANLQLVDKRDWPDKNSYIKQVAATGEKTIIYVNSRIQTIELASYLRAVLPELKDSIVFYNAGMSVAERNEVEKMFRDGDLKVVVSTSAFGEGIDIPDIKHVILYHLNFNFTEFNQQSGRAGRDNNPAKIHILCGKRDIKINEFILDAIAPNREFLKKLYCFLKMESLKNNPITLTNQEIAEGLAQMGIRKGLESTVSLGIGIFEELGLLEREKEGRTRYIYFKDEPPDKIKLENSLRYCEGVQERRAFADFYEFFFNADSSSLLSFINQPIYPKKRF